MCVNHLFATNSNYIQAVRDTVDRHIQLQMHTDVCPSLMLTVVKSDSFVSELLVAGDSCLNDRFTFIQTILTCPYVH